MAEELAEVQAATTPEEVLAALAADKGKDGFQDQLDGHHTVTFIARGPKLLVTFEAYEETLRVAKTGLPIGLDFADDKNYSLLHFSTDSESWFRAPAVYEFFDELVDDAFFEDFDQVTFYGASMGGYAACAFSVAAPGSNVLAISPQATLDTERAGWDHRFPDARRLKFSDRYGYAPDMLEGAGQAYILFDPYRPLDHVHASLFQGPNVLRLKCRHFDSLIELALREMDLLHRVVELASENALTRAEFFTLLRGRRQHTRYLRTLMHALDMRNKPLRTAVLCQHVLQRKDAPVFRKRLNAIRQMMIERDMLPDWLKEEDTAA